MVTRPSQPPSWLPRRVHYGWVVVVVGVLATLCNLGLGRFAFGMILPSMGAGLSLSYSQMGIISTANFVGYLVGALVCGRLTSRFGARGTITASLVLIAASLAVVGFATGFWLALVAFSIAGFGSGTGNVATIGLVSHWFLRSVRGKASGLVVTGSGYAIMLSGVVIPRVNTRFGDSGWRVNWWIIAGVVALTAAICFRLLRNRPEDLGLTARGHSVKDAVLPEPIAGHEQRRTTVRLGVIYGLFGASYIVYVTFIVTTLVAERGFDESAAGWFWFAVGFLSIFSGPIFGALSDRAGRKIGLAAVFGMHTISFLLVGLNLPNPFLYASIVFFGLAAWSIPGIMGATVGDYMPPHQAVHSLGILTVFFGVGQSVGPALAGVLADRSGSFDSSYLLAAVLAALGAVGALTMRQPGTTTPRQSLPAQ